MSMMTHPLIRLTSKNGNPIYVNPQTIVTIGTNDAGTTEIDCHGVPFTVVVEESAEDVVAAVTEARG